MSTAVQHLRTLPSIRERCAQVFKLAEKDELEYFKYDAAKLPDAIEYCSQIIKRDFGSNFASIPPHGRWRHFDALSLPRITTLLSKWGAPTNGSTPVPPLEAARRLVDLFVVSVLLDAGAGPTWCYEERATGLRIGRSEGLAVASLDMFTQGVFALPEQADGKDAEKERCEAGALASLTPSLLAISLQVDPQSNPMEGLEGRAGLLARLGDTLSKDTAGFFKGPADAATPADRRRPGFLVDYLATHPSTRTTPEGRTQVSVPVLWAALIEGLAPVWPTEGRTVLDGTVMGDVWPCPALAKSLGVKLGEQESLVPFHKLSQWLCYSIMEPMEKTLGWEFVDGDAQTGLPEYRNGGLLIDLGVLTPLPSLYAASSVKAGPPPSGPIPRLPPSHPAVVEWRACTVMLLDAIAGGIRSKAGLSKEQLNLKQVLEAATWKGGREIAKEKRPESGGGPPIAIDSDGTVF